MGVVFTPKHITWQRKQCVLTHSMIMRYHTENVYWNVVPNFLVLIFLASKQMISIPAPVLQFVSYYHLIACCKKHGRLSLFDKKSCRECQQDTASVKSTKIYTRKELVMMETTISNFHKSFFIPAIQKFSFHIPCVQILGTNHCGDFFRTAFKRRE